MTQPAAVEVAVIGGGVIGLACALRLAEVRRVALIDPPASKNQASLASGAMLSVVSEISPHDEPEHQALQVKERLRARRMYPAWLATVSAMGRVEVPIRHGTFIIANAEGDDDRVALTAIGAAAESTHLDVERVGGRDIPGLAPDRLLPILDALYIREEASVDTSLLLMALRAAAERHPRIVRHPTRALRLTPAKDCLTVHLQDGNALDAPSVICAGGVDTSELLHASPDLGVDPPVLHSGRGVSIQVRTPLTFAATVRTPNRGFACGLHAVPRDDGSLYIGATNRLSTSPDLDRAATLNEIDILLRGAQRELNTALRDAELIKVRVGHRPLTLDRLPLVGRTDNPNVILATGTYRNGMLLAPRIAELVADEIERPGASDSHPFTPRRLVHGRGDLIEVVGRASRALVAGHLSPGGTLGPGRSDELERFLAAAFGSLLSGAGTDPHVTRTLERIVDRAPIEENLPLLFDYIARRGE